MGGVGEGAVGFGDELAVGLLLVGVLGGMERELGEKIWGIGEGAGGKLVRELDEVGGGGDALGD